MIPGGRTIQQPSMMLSGTSVLSGSAFEVISHYPIIPPEAFNSLSSAYEAQDVDARLVDLGRPPLAPPVFRNESAVATGDSADKAASAAKGAYSSRAAASDASPRAGGGGGGFDSDLARQVEEVIFRPPIRHGEDTFPPDLLRDRERVREKAQQLQLFEAIGMLTAEEIREGELLRLFRHATHKEEKIWRTARWLLQDYFPDELEEVTRAFEAKMAASERPLHYEVRLFVARSPFASREFLTEHSIKDDRVSGEALENLLRRRLLTSLRDIPPRFYMSVAESQWTHRKLIGELIFTDAGGGEVAVTALKRLFGKGGDEKVRKLIILVHNARRRIPSSVLHYVVTKLKPTKGELLSLVGLGRKGGTAGVDRVTESIAAEIARGLAGKNPNLEELSKRLPPRALKKRELELLYGNMGPDARGKALIVNPPRYGKPMPSGEWLSLVRMVAKELVDRDLLTAEDLEDLAQQNTAAAHHILTSHPATRVKHLLPILVRSKAYDMAAFKALSENMERHPMLTWPELISWATRSGNPIIRARALARPEALIEQLLYHLDEADGVIEQAREKGKRMGLGPDSFVDGNWERLKETAIKGLLAKLPEKIVSFTHVLMAIESGSADGLERELGSHRMRHTAEPLPREELALRDDSLAGLSADEMVRRIRKQKLDIRQKIALLCEADDRVALAAWNHLTSPQSKGRPRLLSRKRAIAWALRSNSLGLKLHVIEEPKILVEHLLALLVYSIGELKSEGVVARRRELESIRDASIKVLRRMIPEKVAGYLDALPEVQREAMRYRWFAFNPSDLVEESRRMVAPLLVKVRDDLNAHHTRDWSRPESLLAIKGSLMTHVLRAAPDELARADLIVGGL